jgi:decaprenyl-phosphate phosphoribosyltransferase
MRLFIRLIRLEHWVKNLFIFIPSFFAARLSDPAVLTRALLGFLAFSLVASAVYIFNDLIDAPQDRHHPQKKKRPIASGQVSVALAAVLMVALLISGFSLAVFLGWKPLLITAGYMVINLCYTLYLKHIAIIDISLIGLGFLMRVWVGGAVTGVAVSHWLIVLTFILALILGLAKRRGEYVIATGGQTFRKALEGYNLPFLDVGITVCSTVAIVAYIMYCFSPEVTSRIGSDRIFYTAFFVVVGILRYLQLTLVFNRTESPTRALLNDTFLQLVLLAWIGCFAYLLYY